MIIVFCQIGKKHMRSRARLLFAIVLGKRDVKAADIRDNLPI